jgi:nitrate reductase cytochrome c-type subunit
MTKEKKEQKALPQEGSNQKASVNNVESNNNKALLWAIFSALIILIGLVVAVTAVSVLRPTKSTEMPKQEHVNNENDSSKSNTLTDQKPEENMVAKPPAIPVQNVENNKPLPKKKL